MKKYLLILGFAFVFSFCCACNAVTPGPSTTRSSAAVSKVATTPAAEVKVETTTEAATTEAVTEPAETESTEAMLSEEEGEKVKATEELNVRDAASAESNIMGVLDPGEVVVRIGREEGWSVIMYHGQKAYVASRYLTSAE